MPVDIVYVAPKTPTLVICLSASIIS